MAFPNPWYSSRYQLQALAETGSALASDMRGYGQADRLDEIDPHGAPPRNDGRVS
jgi:hypothetical protein